MQVVSKALNIECVVTVKKTALFQSINKIRDLFKVKLYTIKSETKKRERERERERERDSKTLNVY